jgi:hypothetical protein
LFQKSQKGNSGYQDLVLCNNAHEKSKTIVMQSDRMAAMAFLRKFRHVEKEEIEKKR